MSIAAIAILAVTLVYGSWASRRWRCSLADLNVALMMISCQMILAEQTVLQVPLRIIAFSLAIVLIAQKMRARVRILKAVEARKIVAAWLLYAACIWISQTANGELSTFDALVDFVSRYGYALFLFLVIGAAASNVGGALAIGVWIAVVGFANCLAALAQMAGIELAFDAQRQLFPVTRALEAQLISEGLITSFGYLPALSAFSIVAGYAITCFPIFAAGHVFNRGRMKWLLAVAAVLVVVSLSGTAILSRSTLICGAFGVAAFIVLGLRTAKANAGFVMLLCLGSLSVGVLFDALFGALTSSVQGGSRLQTLADSQRGDLFQVALDFFLTHPVVGGSADERLAWGVGAGAHNVIMNGLVNFGLMGGVPMMMFLVAATSYALKAVAASRGTRAEGVVIAACAASLAYTAKSFVHNESIATSGITFMMLIGLSVAGYNERRKMVERSTRVAWAQPSLSS